MTRNREAHLEGFFAKMRLPGSLPAATDSGRCVRLEFPWMGQGLPGAGRVEGSAPGTGGTRAPPELGVGLGDEEWLAGEDRVESAGGKSRAGRQERAGESGRRGERRPRLPTTMRGRAAGRRR